MQFEVRHRLPRPAAVAWREVFSDAYEDAFDGNSTMLKQLLEAGEREGRRFRRSALRGRDPLPAAFARLIGATHLAYELHEQFEDGSFRMEWRVVPERHADKVKASGSYTLIDLGEECERLVKGEILVAIPLVGGKIEAAIGDELRAGWERGADFARNWLLERT